MFSVERTVLILNGPNINLIGKREKKIYGSTHWETIEKNLLNLSHTLKIALTFFQSNSESLLIEKLHSLLDNPVGSIIFNPAGFTSYSVSLRDALLAVDIPFYEVHLSNIYKRGSFHQTSVFSDIAKGVFIGLGKDVYNLALYASYLQIANDH